MTASTATLLPLSATKLALSALGLLVLYKLASVFYTAFLSPLAKVPGPRLCALTSFVDSYQSMVGGRRAEWIHSLHQTYGPIVRIAPNLCSISDPADLKTVYSGKFGKSPRSYDNKHVDGIEHMLILREPRAVKTRRGLLLPLFQRTNLETFYPELERYTSILLRQIEAEQKSEGSVDIFRWFRLVAFDIIGMLAYGVDMQMTQTGKVAPLVELMASLFFAFVGRDFIPGFDRIAKMRIFPPFTATADAHAQFRGYATSIVDGMLAKGELDDARIVSETEKTNLLKSLYRSSKAEPSITRDHIETEAGAILVAGSDTTSTAMTYALYEIAKNRDLQEKIRKELISINEDPNDWPSIKDLESLPLFNAFLKETLRRWPTLPGPLERSVPEGGAVLQGYFLPADAEVTMHAYSIHRDPGLFPDAEAFKPERWLNETAELRNAFIPFSYGPRNCVGMNLAWAEMRFILGSLLRRYRVVPDPSTNDQTMSPVEHFFVVPKSLSCRVRLEGVH
ncbi:cytochrome P450 [Cystobasidium minutum MCA 4210]|uniref:cytochrome P450 n=1 Tax=Cystobasidium minutum MCA 4210 TaxID=1397322 RepID=UPI0034CF191D|eukprot:jgi/Rhomi1/171588/fgenesh1_kg.4_\